MGDYAKIAAQGGAKCKICGQHMLIAAGCKVSKVFVSGKAYQRIKCGDELDFDPNMDDGDRCHDCGAEKGFYHHYNCDAERCPVCGEQLVSCDCDIEFEEDLN